MDLRTWLLAELDDTAGRLERQVLARVPVERRGERPGGGNSITWSTFHLARHGDLALAVLRAGEPQRTGGGGLEEAEQDWAAELVPQEVDAYALGVLAAARELVASGPDLDAVPDADAALARADVPRDRFDWLYEQWSGQPAAFLVRWPLIGHVQLHLGEMLATRNRMGLSPHS
jgi:hypothetical protein